MEGHMSRVKGAFLGHFDEHVRAWMRVACCFHGESSAPELLSGYLDFVRLLVVRSIEGRTIGLSDRAWFLLLHGFLVSTSVENTRLVYRRRRRRRVGGGSSHWERGANHTSNKRPSRGRPRPDGVKKRGGSRRDG